MVVVGYLGLSFCGGGRCDSGCCLGRNFRESDSRRSSFSIARSLPTPHPRQLLCCQCIVVHSPALILICYVVVGFGSGAVFLSALGLVITLSPSGGGIGVACVSAAMVRHHCWSFCVPCTTSPCCWSAHLSCVNSTLSHSAPVSCMPIPLLLCCVFFPVVLDCALVQGHRRLRVRLRVHHGPSLVGLVRDYSLGIWTMQCPPLCPKAYPTARP